MEEKLNTLNGNTKNRCDNSKERVPKQVYLMKYCIHCGSSNLLFTSPNKFEYCQDCLTVFQSHIVKSVDNNEYIFNFFCENSWIEVSKYCQRIDFDKFIKQCPFDNIKERIINESIIP